MDLENIWHKSDGEDEQLARLLKVEELSRLQSGLPLQKLKKALLAGLAWAALITAGYAILFFYTPIWPVRLALVIVSLANLWIISDSWRLYRTTNADVTPSNSVKAELQKNYDSFQRWWRMQERVSLFIYPVAVAGGFILGGSVGSNRSLEDFLYNLKVLLVLGICILVLVPTCYYLARRMFNYAYGRHLKKLKALIDELETNEA